MEFKARTIAGKCLQEKPNLVKTCSRYNDSNSCISPSVSVTESIGSHDDKGIMCSNTFSEVKGSNCVSFDASRTVKPSGLRMPSPNIGYFDMVSST